MFGQNLTAAPQPPAELVVQDHATIPSQAEVATGKNAQKPSAPSAREPAKNANERAPTDAHPEALPTPRPSGSVDVKLSVPSPHDHTPITLHVDDLDVRKALEMLSREAGVNILVSPGVSGKVTINLRNKTLYEILSVLADLCHFVVRREQDVIFVTTPAEVRAGEEDELPVRVYHLNYVKSNDLEAMIKPLLSKRGTMSCSPESGVGIKGDSEDTGGNSMAGGEILVVQDYEQVLRTVDHVVAQIDVQPNQVLIQAVILQVTLDKNAELGVNFALLDGVIGGAAQSLGTMGTGAAINAAAGFTPAQVLTTGGKLVEGFAEDTNGLKFGFVSSNVTGFIDALEKLGDTKVLACPRLLVLNKQRAEIQLGDRLGYQTATQTQTSTVQEVQFMDVGTLLRLRPFISSDGVIRMEIHPERSSGHIDEAGVPQTHSTQVTTNVMVPNGATIVIGGLMDNEVKKDWQGLPLLSRLPWIGFLFRHTADSTVKKELIVILTPHVWQPETPQSLNRVGCPFNLGTDPWAGQRPCVDPNDGPSPITPSMPIETFPDNPSIDTIAVPGSREPTHP